MKRAAESEMKMMDKRVKVNIYGDSLMRATVMDDNSRYHSLVGAYLERLSGEYDIVFRNRARFGITVEKGSRVLEKDLAAGLDCDYAVLEFGGNDCSFCWEAVAKNPEEEHLPFTPREMFEATLADMVKKVEAAGVVPVLVTLPPIDAQRHLEHVGKTEQARKNILQWLGDTQMIYRFHELYSQTVAGLAHRAGAILVDVRSRFLCRHDLKQLVGDDGVHPSATGYEVVVAAFADFIRAHRSQPPRLVYA